MATAALAPLLGLFLTDCGSAGGGGGDGTPEVGVTEVSIHNFTFTPKDVTIKQGEKVRWTNDEGGFVRHTVTSGNPGDADAGVTFDSGAIAPRGTFTHPFDDLGTFTYFCNIHKDDPAMRDATVTVEATDGQP